MFRNLIINYFNRAKLYPVSRLLLEFTFVDLLAKIFIGMAPIIVLIPLGLIRGDVSGFLSRYFVTDDFGLTTGEIFLIGVLVAPFLETFLFQVIPVWITSLFTRRQSLQILISSLVFALIHITPLAIFAAFPGGILLAWTLITRSQQSKIKAFFITTIMHAMFNLLALFLQYAFP